MAATFIMSLTLTVKEGLLVGFVLSVLKTRFYNQRNFVLDMPRHTFVKFFVDLLSYAGSGMYLVWFVVACYWMGMYKTLRF